MDLLNNEKKPNVLFIAVDDMRPFLGCYGDQNAHTPNIDSLAERGVMFSNAMCTAPACGPSRAAVLSGKYPTKTGIYYFQDWAGRKEFESFITLPEYFRQNGYKTFSSGKIHHDAKRVHSYTQKAVDANLSDSEPDPFVKVARADREWDVNNVFVVNDMQYNHNPCIDDCIYWGAKPQEQAIKEKDYKLFSGPSDDSTMECQDGATVGFGVDILKQKHEDPFFLALGFVRPHLPFIAPRKYYEKYPIDSLSLNPIKHDDLNDVPWAGKRFAKVHDDIRIREADKMGRERVAQSYYACVSFVDDMVGLVLRQLEKSPYKDNTIIVFWSDHGWHLGEKRSWRKFTLWEESARTPMIIVDPREKQNAGMICDKPVGLIDLYPTMAAMCGMEVLDDLDGSSLFDLVKNPNNNSAQFSIPELTVYGKGNYSLRDETWRYIHYFDGSEELYNHKDDPYEWTNLADIPDCFEIKQYMRYYLPKSSAATVHPRNLWSMADEEESDLEEFKDNVWPKWLQRAYPPLV